MNKLDIPEISVQCFVPVFQFESCLINYLNAVCVLFECQLEIGNEKLLAGNLYRIVKQVNELQKQMNKKLAIFMEWFPESEIYPVYRSHEKYHELYKKDRFPELIQLIHQITKRSTAKNWMHNQISIEVNEAIQLYRKRKALLTTCRPSKNDTKTVWLTETLKKDRTKKRAAGDRK